MAGNESAPKSISPVSSPMSEALSLLIGRKWISGNGLPRCSSKAPLYSAKRLRTILSFGVQLTNSYGPEPTGSVANFSPRSSTAFFGRMVPDAVGKVERMIGANGSLRTIVPDSLSLTITSLR